MKVLMSCVGNSDPIRGMRDGALLHLARKFKPEKIVVLNTEHTVSKSENIKKAIYAIPNYAPEIIFEEKIIKDEDAVIFDKAFLYINEIVRKYAVSEDRLILNLTSATAQLMSALFTINRLGEYNTEAYQVVTPLYGSNENLKYSNKIDIDYLIQHNLDNVEDFEERIIKDEADNFKKVLIKRTFIDLIKNYDYGALEAELIRNNVLSRSKSKKVNSIIQPINSAIKTQKIFDNLPEIDRYTDSERKLLTSFLIILLQAKRGLVSEVLIRAKSFVEFSIELYFEKNYPDLIERIDGKPRLNKDKYPKISEYLHNLDGKNYYDTTILSLGIYHEILTYIDKNNPILKDMGIINSLNGYRNRVAHGLEEIPGKQVKLDKIWKACYRILQFSVSFEYDFANYYEGINNHLFEIIEL